MQYEQKLFVCKMKDNQHLCSVEQQMWESVNANDTKGVYRHIVCSGADINAIHGQALFSTLLTLANVLQLEESGNLNLNFDCFAGDYFGEPSASYLKSLHRSEDQLIKEFSDSCPLLHLACLTADNGMVELLLQYGANINAFDSKGQTALHYCIISKRYAIAKLLLAR